MNKQDIQQCFVDQLTKELAAITAAARNSFTAATSEAHHAESKYDTFSLESSYLARGQAKRVDDLSNALERLQLLPLTELGENTPIQLSALVRLENADGGRRTLFLCAAGGGEQISLDGEDIIIVTSRSPLGQAVLGRTVGDTFDVNMAGTTQTLRVVSVE